MTPNPHAQNPALDAIIVGAGFSGVSLLHRLRQAGFTARIFEKAPHAGGVWYWNCYPGAQVDSAFPSYQLSFPEVYKEWDGWTEKYPKLPELRKYFDFVLKRLDLRKDIQFNSTVTGARWNNEKEKWIVTVEEGYGSEGYEAKFLFMCIGSYTKPYIPDLDGLENFGGQYFHSALWPQAPKELNLAGKKIGIFGTGATGVQIIQELGPIADKLTLFQRTPSLACPLRQRNLTPEDNGPQHNDSLAGAFRKRQETFSGLFYDFQTKPYDKTTPEERQTLFNEKWEEGGFSLWLNIYMEYLFNKEVNDEVYAFWRDNVRKRISDPAKVEILAPTVPPHAFGTKRVPLETNYWEVVSQPNVEIVDLTKNPIGKVTTDGIITKDGNEHKIDILIFATGFDTFYEGFGGIDFRGINGVSLKEKWAQQTFTYLGMTTSLFPNMFIMYGGQGPTPLCNGPTCIDAQGEWLVNCLVYMKEKGLHTIETTPESEKAWVKKVNELWEASLFSQTDSYYSGKNIPGKKAEVMVYIGGLPTYKKHLKDEVEINGYKSFQFNKKVLPAEVYSNGYKN